MEGLPVVREVNMESSEHNHQIGFLRWFKNRYPDIMIFAIPNGGKRDISTAKRLKEEGVLKGVPDLMVPSKKLFLEFKRAKGGVISKDQEKVIAYLQRVGYTVLICRGAEDGSRQVLDFLKEKKP